MTTEYDFAISRRMAPELCFFFSPSENRGRREDRIGVKVARASIDTDVFEEARAGAAQALVFCGGSNGWLVVE
ncbi:hypothetical protein LMTR13_11020 [Bradyrhizobium icense]|uniref:Uncharacterized protein n=1 Tax=Bradyrhizobium icense TaxID=1274631 RepID=A0A1B1UCX5_9BRAD|nr:hypothetical protein LMTR13_11020 [Bradyrhizobium icense]